MTKYHGICVGGPLAGQWVTHSVPTLRCSTSQVGYIDCKEVDFDTLCAISDHQHFTYCFHEFPLVEGTTGFWIPENGTLFWALREIIETYSMYEGLKT